MFLKTGQRTFMAVANVPQAVTPAVKEMLQLELGTRKDPLAGRYIVNHLAITSTARLGALSAAVQPAGHAQGCRSLSLALLTKVALSG